MKPAEEYCLKKLHETRGEIIHYAGRVEDAAREEAFDSTVIFHAIAEMQENLGKMMKYANALASACERLE